MGLDYGPLRGVNQAFMCVDYREGPTIHGSGLREGTIIYVCEGPTLHGSGLWEGTMIYVSGLQGRTNHTLIRTIGEDTSSIGPDLQQKDLDKERTKYI